jgi:hypothetical protein
VSVGKKEWLRDKKIRIILQTAPERAKISLMRRLARDRDQREDKQVISSTPAVRSAAPSAPPDMPPERVKYCATPSTRWSRIQTHCRYSKVCRARAAPGERVQELIKARSTCRRPYASAARIRDRGSKRNPSAPSGSLNVSCLRNIRQCRPIFARQD